MTRDTGSSSAASVMRLDQVAQGRGGELGFAALETIDRSRQGREARMTVPRTGQAELPLEQFHFLPQTSAHLGQTGRTIPADGIRRREFRVVMRRRRRRLGWASIRLTPARSRDGRDGRR